MKKYIIIALVAFSALLPRATAVAQSPGDFDALFRKYAGQENYTTLELTGALLQMLTGDKEGSFAGLTSVKMITTDSGADLGREIRAVSDRNGFEALMNISDGGEGFEILYKEKGKGAAEYVMLAIDGSGVTMIYLVGDIDFRNLAKLARIEVGGSKK